MCSLFICWRDLRILVRKKMQHSSYAIQEQGKPRIFLQRWLPETAPRALICLVHGQSDHSGRYHGLADFFTGNGMGLFAADLPGHGKSGGQRGHIADFGEYLPIPGLLIREARSAFPGIPVFLYGQSMGGMIVLHYAFQHPEEIQGLIVSSPWIRLAFDPPAWKLLLGKTVRSILPSLSQPTGLNAKMISRDPEAVKAYEEDPMVHGKISANAFFIIRKQGFNILENDHSLQVPMLLMHGTGDRITDYTASRALAARFPHMITYVEFPDQYHELHNEPEKEFFYAKIKEWMRKQILL